MTNPLSVAKKLILHAPLGLSGRVSEAFLADLQPRFLWLEAIDRCNNRCAFCNRWQEATSVERLTHQDLARALNDPLFRQLGTVVVSGGEPTLRDDLQEVLGIVHNAVPRARIVLSSNGALPGRLVEVVRCALSGGVELEVGISVDGIGAKHDRVRGIDGLFGRVDKSLRGLVALRRRFPGRLLVVVSFVLSDLTAGQMDAVVRYAEQLGVVFNAQWYHQAAYYGNLGNDLLSGKGAVERAAKKLRPSVLHALGIRALQGRPGCFSCSSLFNFCLLKSNGDMVPCFGMWDLDVGNVRIAPPSVIWKSLAAREARRKVRGCAGCLNTCGVLWSYDSNYLGRLGFYARHPRTLLGKAREAAGHSLVRAFTRA